MKNANLLNKTGFGDSQNNSTVSLFFQTQSWLRILSLIFFKMAFFGKMI